MRKNFDRFSCLSPIDESVVRFSYCVSYWLSKLAPFSRPNEAKPKQRKSFDNKDWNQVCEPARMGTPPPKPCFRENRWALKPGLVPCYLRPYQNQPCLGLTRFPALDTGYTHLLHYAFSLIFFTFFREIIDPQINLKPWYEIL